MFHNILKILIVFITLYFFINYYHTKDTKDNEGFLDMELPKDKAIKLTVKHPKKEHQIGLNNVGTYLDSLFLALKIHIFPFPSKNVNTTGSIQNIQKLINKELDLAFIDEEILLAYINEDEFLKKVYNIKEFSPINFSLVGVCYDTPFLFVTIIDTNIKTFSDIEKVKYQTKDSSAKIGTKENVKIGVLGKSADEYHLKKILNNSNFKINEDVYIKLFSDYETMKKSLLLEDTDSNKIHIIFITDTKKNEILFDLTENGDCRFLSPVIKNNEIEISKYIKLINNYEKENYMVSSRNIKDIYNVYDKKNTIGLHINDMGEFDELLKVNIPFISKKGNTIKNIKNTIKIFKDYKKLIDNFKSDSSDSINIVFLPQNNSTRQKLFLEIDKTLFEKIKLITLKENPLFNKLLKKKELMIQNELKDRNKLILKNFYSIHRKTVNLNDFYNNINTSHSLDTYSTKLILVARDDLFDKNIEKLTEKYIKNLSFLKHHINTFKNKKQFINYTVQDAFNFNNLINVKEDIPIHNGSKDIYKKYKLLQTKTIYETNI